MPEMDGIECYRKIRELGLNTRVLIVTAVDGMRFISAFEEGIRSVTFSIEGTSWNELLNAVSVVMADEPTLLLRETKKKCLKGLSIL